MLGRPTGHEGGKKNLKQLALVVVHVPHQQRKHDGPTRTIRQRTVQITGSNQQFSQSIRDAVSRLVIPANEQLVVPSRAFVKLKP
jgi:hypothetical protein